MPRSNLRSLFEISWPILIAQIAIILNGVADTIMTGHYQPAHLAAIGLGASIYVSINMGLASILNALSPIVAQRHGAGHYQEIGHDVHQAIWAALLLSMLGVALLSYPAPFLRLAQAPPEVEILVRRYLHYVAWGIPAAMAARLFYSFTSAIGRSKPVMIINLLALACKVPLSYLFLHGGLGFTGYGAPGCALASSITAWLMLLLSLSFILIDVAYRPFNLFERFVWPEWARLKTFFKLGIPIGLSAGIETTAFTFVALFLARFGAHVSSAHQIVANLTALLYMVPLSLGIGASVLVAQAIGKGQLPEAKRLGNFSLKVMASWSVVIGLLLVLFREQIVHLYTNDATVALIAGQLIFFIAIYQFFDAQQALIAAILRGYKKTTVPMVIFFASLWGIGLGGGYILGLRPFESYITIPFFLVGARGFWLAEVISVVITVMLMYCYYNRVKKNQ